MREKEKEGGRERERKRGSDSYMIKQAVLPALKDDVVSDVSIDERREAILISRGGDLDGVGNH